MSTCTICKGPMQPLFTGSFCPNDCDRKPPPPPEPDWKVMLSKGCACGRPWVLHVDRYEYELDGRCIGSLHVFSCGIHNHNLRSTDTTGAPTLQPVAGGWNSVFPVP